MVALNRRYGQLYTQADYDCQECGKPETDAMRKRATDFVRPTCDECIERLAHDGHKQVDTVGISRVTLSQKAVKGHDGVMRLQAVETRDERRVKYRDWDGRCLKCFPVIQSKESRK